VGSRNQDRLKSRKRPAKEQVEGEKGGELEKNRLGNNEERRARKRDLGIRERGLLASKGTTYRGQKAPSRMTKRQQQGSPLWAQRQIPPIKTASHMMNLADDLIGEVEEKI